MRRIPIALATALLSMSSLLWSAEKVQRPNIIFVMADDMGWGETGYRNHPVLKTPNLDAMAAESLRFDRFYAGCPVCSPTRATVLTGRANDRTGVLSWGYALRLQEKTISQALQKAGYVTGHFGKWHLDGFSGPGVPILKNDPRRPDVFGFDEWVSVTNFFEVNPLMSDRGRFEDFQGDSSDVAMSEGIKFLEHHHKGEKPMFALIWYGSPHAPFISLPEDRAAFQELNQLSANHYGELVGLDRSIGTLRKKLREMKIADNTLLVFCSDNGGLPRVAPETVGGLRGFKGSVYEGGLRVPGIFEWPDVIKTPRITNYPASTMDLFPTVAEILDLPASDLIEPIDGVSLLPLFHNELPRRQEPIAFRYREQRALVDNQYKLLTTDIKKGKFELYHLETDHDESHDISQQHPELAQRMKKELLDWNTSVDASFAGMDYPEKKVTPPDPEPIRWVNSEEYKPYLKEWRDRPEYRKTILKAEKQKKKKN